LIIVKKFGFIVINAPEFDININAVRMFFAVELGRNVEILLAFDIEYTEKLVISFETSVKFKSRMIY